MPLNEHVCCVAITFKLTEQGEQQICIKFCINLEHSSVETIQMIKRPQLGATGDRQLYHNSVVTPAILSNAEILAKLQITQMTQPP